MRRPDTLIDTVTAGRPPRVSALPRLVTAGPTRSLRDPVVWVPLLLLVLGAVAVQWSVLQPPHWGDSLRVFDYAVTWPEVPVDGHVRRAGFEVDQHSLRVGVLWPVMAAQAVFGYGQGAYYVVAFGFGVLLVVGVHLVARELFGHLVAVAAAGALVLSPYVTDTERFLTTGLVLPDVPSAGLVALGFAALLAALRRPEQRRRARLLLVTASLLLAGAYLVREYVVVLYVVVPFAFLAWRVPLRRIGWVVAPMLAVLAGELVINGLLFGDPLVRLVVALGHDGFQFSGGAPGTGTPATRLDVVRQSARALQDGSHGGLLVVAGALLAGGTAWLRDRRLGLLCVWAGSLTLVLLLAGGLIDPASPALPLRLTRYWLPLVPALLVGGVAVVGATVDALLARGHTLQAGVAVAVLAVWFGGWVALPAARQVWDHPRDDAWAELRTWLAGDEAAAFDAIWTDSRSDKMLAVYRHEVWGGDEVWDGTIEEFPHVLPTSSVADRVGTATVLFAPEGPPPPDDRTPLWRSTDGTLTVTTVTD